MDEYCAFSSFGVINSESHVYTGVLFAGFTVVMQ